MNVVHNFSFFAAPSTASPLQASMNKLRVASLNINGGRDPQKRALVADMVAQKKLDILLLQETHSDGDNEVDWGLWWRGLSRLSHGTNLSAGVATLFSPRLDVRVTSTTEIAAGRALAVRAEVQGLVFCLINIYAPSQGSDRLDLFQKVSSFVERCGQDECVVMGGDWNCTTDVTLDRIGQKPHLQSAAVLSRLGAELGMLLQDTEFSRRFEAFWGTWRGRKGDFECLGQWWEVGKAHIRAFCQQYSSHTTTRVKHTIEHLEREIRDLEGSFSTHTSTEGHTLRQKRQELSSFLQERVKGALVRSRFTSIKEMDAPTSFFFNLERSVSRAKQMLCLRLPDGTMTADQGEMRRHAVDFYGTLYRAEDCSREDELLQGLPRLSQRDRLTVLPSPAGLIERVQKLIVDFFWSGQHWLRSAVLYLPVQEGGQGLVDIASRVTAFRLQAAQRLLYSLGVPWTDMACLLLRKAGRLGYDKHLFLLQPQSMDLTGLTPFYQSVLKAWQVLSFKHKAVTIPGMWIFEEPLFGNSIITSRVLSSASLRSRLRDAGVVKLGHLLKTSVPDLSDRLNMRSSRLLLQLVREVCASLPEALRVFVLDPSVSELWDDECEYVFPSLAVCPAVGQWQPEEDDLLSLKSSVSVDFEGVGRKDLHLSCEGDLQWRIVHGAVATNRYLVHLDPSTGDGCPFCSQSETIYHLFVQCPRLEGLFGQLQRWFLGLVGHMEDQEEPGERSGVRGGVVAMMTGLLAARLRVEFNFYKLTGQIGTFGDIWGVRDVLSSVRGNCLILNF
ncbi:Transposon TX1 uncharacterized 149 kDa protein ORF 2 [Takifugu flavidus]|uniref:exodeoxyribonuclease III n=1 Tax=Takifugu flavidus TaxID=433684 RepID=A0A5C6PFY0_9TELE|nr:Transposon TX1 uncharacterized 149 kDa protein ORF 2 [Takifugu flavidus]